MRIQRLPTLLANQIAAGEVIERPASVVKELLENAYDAKADTITIEIGFGGFTLIKVSDNGIGIDSEDLPLAIAPHATSKLSELNDLYNINTMGFRGEALASIASISKFSIESKTANTQVAMKLSLEGSSIELSPCARNQGTTIEVKDLFYNAPVRKKFLHSAQTEFQAIEAVVKRFALAAPHISIVLKHQDKVILSLPKSINQIDFELRIRKVLGKPFLEHAKKIEIERGSLHMKAWICKASYQRSQNDKQWIYVNNRMVKDRFLFHVIKKSYDGIIYPGRFPACLIYLTLPPAEVDVNVHPTKYEIRFHEPRMVHDFIVSEIGASLIEANPSARVEADSQNKLLSTRMEQFETIHSQKQWIILNASYVLIDRQHVYYLIDLSRMLTTYWHQYFTQQSLPLCKRNLSVPIEVNLTSQATKKLESYTNILNEYGIEFSFSTPTTLLLRTLPECLPHLMMQKVIIELGTLPPLSSENIIKLLIKHNKTNVYHFTQQEINHFMDYINHTLVQNIQVSWVKPLTEAHCKALIYG